MGQLLTIRPATEMTPADISTLFGHVGVAIPADDIDTWSQGQRLDSVRWASAAYIGRNNIDAFIPPVPATVIPYLNS